MRSRPERASPIRRDSWIMPRMSSSRLAVAVAIVMSASLHAQWLNYPTRGVPRTLDGKPDLSAPAPRAAAGKPDLSGCGNSSRGRAGRRGAGTTRQPLSS